jgi:squalene-hopene/tetraprenyl-beta-curcumene cyclase
MMRLVTAGYLDHPSRKSTMNNGRCAFAIMSGLTFLLAAIAPATAQKKSETPRPQYEFEKIVIPGLTADEPVRKQVSVELASEYLEKGALAWSKTRKCVTCHTNGTYMTMRPALTPQLGKPSADIRKFFVETLASLKTVDHKKMQTGTRPAQAIYIAAGLAEWDAHVTGKLSPETDDALRFAFGLQQESGTWASLDCWPPFESSAYQEATVAAMGSATAPGWLKSLNDDALKTRIEKMKTYLRTTKPPHDYARVLLLWTATRMPDLIDAKQKQELIATIWKHQRKDGGWSIRTFVKPTEWGRGNRAEKLKAEPEFANPSSDGHQTGLAVLVLRDAGVPANDARIQKAVSWLKANQRESGRWYTRSLNTDRYHFVAYSGTIYPLVALAKCNALPAE